MDINTFIQQNKGLKINSTLPKTTSGFQPGKGIQKLDLNSIEGLKAALEKAGYPAPKPKEPFSALKRFAGILNVPNAFVAGGVKAAVDKDPKTNIFTQPFKSAYSSFKGDELIGFSDVIRAGGYDPQNRSGKFIVGTLGFAGDVLFDPLTYLTLGVSSAAKSGKLLNNVVLNKPGRDLFFDISKEMTAKLGNKGEKETALLFEKAIGKKGLTDKDIIDFSMKGFKKEDLLKLQKEAPNLKDLGGIKFAGKSLVTGKQISDSVVGDAYRVLSNTNVAKDVKKVLGTMFVPDFMKLPKVTKALEKATRSIRNNVADILKFNEELFSKVPPNQLDKFTSVVRAKKKEIVPKPEDITRRLSLLGLKDTKKNIEKVESILRSENKARQINQDLSKEFADSPELLELSEKLFGKSQVFTKADGSKVTKFRPGVLQRFSRLAGLNDDDAIRFYFPDQLKKDLDKGMKFSKAVSVPKLDSLEKFRGLLDQDQIISDPFEAFTRNQIAIVTARGKDRMVRTLMRELGKPLSELTEQEAKQLGYVKFTKRLLPTTKEMSNMKESRNLLSSLTQSYKKLRNLINKESRLLSSTDKNITNKYTSKMNQIDILAKKQSDNFSSLDKVGKEITDIDAPSIKTGDIRQSIKDIEKRRASLVTLKSQIIKQRKTVNKQLDVAKSKHRKKLTNVMQKFGKGGFFDTTVRRNVEDLFIVNKRYTRNHQSLIKKRDQLDEKIRLYEDNESSFTKELSDLSNKLKVSKYKTNRLTESNTTGNIVGSIIDTQSRIDKFVLELGNLNIGKSALIRRQIQSLQNVSKDFVTRMQTIQQSGTLKPDKMEGWIPKSIQKEMDDFMQPKDNTLEEFTRVFGFDWATGLFKGYVTSLFPAFHVRNIAGNAFNSMLKIGVDAVNPRFIAISNDILKGKNLDKVITSKSGRTYTYGQIRKIIEEESNILSRSGAFGNVELGIEQGAKNIRKTPTAKMLTQINPLSRENIALKKGQEIGQYFEDTAKIRVVVSEILNGGTVKQGIKASEDALFDYSKLTPFERRVMKRLIPFYTFARKNFELQMKTLVSDPSAIANQLKGIRSAGEVIGEPISSEDEKGLPDWVLESLGIKAGVNEFGQSRFITGFGLPIEEFFQRFSGKDGFVWNSMINTLTQSNPLIKYPLETIFDKDLFRDRPISEITDAQDVAAVLSMFGSMDSKASKQLQDLIQFRKISKPIYRNNKVVGKRDAYVANPHFLHLFRSLPSARITATAGRFSDPTQTMDDKLLSFLTGVRRYSIDQETQNFYRELNEKRELQQLLYQLGIVNKTEIFYKKK